MNPHQAEAAALVETQGINIIVGGNDLLHCRQSCPGTYVSTPAVAPSTVSAAKPEATPGHRLVGGLPRTNDHRTNVTAMEERAIALLVRQESR
jgi:hypothetical protein